MIVSIHIGQVYGRLGDVELGREKTQTFTAGFEIGFFACPVSKERGGYIIGRQGGQDGPLTRGEVVLSNLVRVLIGPKLFDVNANFSLAGKGVEGQLASACVVKVVSMRCDRLSES